MKASLHHHSSFLPSFLHHLEGRKEDGEGRKEEKTVVGAGRQVMKAGRKEER